MQPNIERLDVTPELAREWLGYNTHNRRIRQRVVEAFARDMASGSWHWNGETIKFSEDGALLDGQHRLAALIEADVTIPLLVVRDLPNQTQETMDGGVKRKFSDVLQLRGEENYTQLSSIVRRVFLWENGSFRYRSYVTTNAQLLATLEKYPELREYASRANQVASHCRLPGSIIGWAMWLFYRLDNEDAEYFFKRLASDQEHVSGDPIYELRKQSENSTTLRGTRNEIYLSAITVKAWNAYREGRRIGILVFRPGGAKPGRFPGAEMKINGTPIPHNFPTKKLSGAGGKSGCLPGLLVLAVLGTGWASMLLTGSGWIA